MAELSKQGLDARIDQLPEEIQNMLYSPEMYSTIKQISARHQLHVDQMDLLEVETSQVMLGLTDTTQFAQMIAQSLKIDRSQADTIAKDVDDLLFSKIRDAMKKSYEQPAEKSVVMPSQANATPQPVEVKVVEEKPAQEINPVDLMLSQPTVSVPPQPNAYKIDPYLEPPE